MSEKINTEENIAENPVMPDEKNPMTPEEEEAREQELADFFAGNEQYEKPEVPEAERRECGPEVEQFKEMISTFEATFSLEELYAITNLTREEAEVHPIREPARVALIPILEKLNGLEGQTNISPEQFDELKKKYKQLTQAVGIINSNIVAHDR